MQQDHQNYRKFSYDEKIDVFWNSIRNGYCPFCTIEVCSPYDLCYCVEVKMIPSNEDWRKYIYTKKGDKFIKPPVFARDLEVEEAYICSKPSLFGKTFNEIVSNLLKIQNNM